MPSDPTGFRQGSVLKSLTDTDEFNSTAGYDDVDRVSTSTPRAKLIQHTLPTIKGSQPDLQDMQEEAVENGGVCKPADACDDHTVVIHDNESSFVEPAAEHNKKSSSIDTGGKPENCDIDDTSESEHMRAAMEEDVGGGCALNHSSQTADNSEKTLSEKNGAGRAVNNVKFVKLLGSHRQSSSTDPAQLEDKTAKKENNTENVIQDDNANTKPINIATPIRKLLKQRRVEEGNVEEVQDDDKPEPIDLDASSSAASAFAAALSKQLAKDILLVESAQKKKAKKVSPCFIIILLILFYKIIISTDKSCLEK